ncbi:hypothetical protein ACFL5V_06255 [Fibrobacterota bacterium]
MKKTKLVFGILVPALLLVALSANPALAAAPVVSNVAVGIMDISDNGRGMLTRTFEIRFDLADADGDVCRIWPGIRGVERNPVLENEGPYLFYKNVSGDLEVPPGVGYTVTLTVDDPAGEFDQVRAKITAWDQEGWPPWPNKPFNPRHHAWSMDVRSGRVHSNSAGFCSWMGGRSTAFLRLIFDFAIFRVEGDHERGAPNITTYASESDRVDVPFPHTSLGDPYTAYPEGNEPGQSCENSGGDCHIEIVDVDNWMNWSMWRSFSTGSGPYDWDVAQIAEFDYNEEEFSVIGSQSGSPVGAYRPLGWTSGDAAGLSIVPGVVKLDDINDGEIQTALRTTSLGSGGYYVHPASHEAGSMSGDAAPMGMRWRLKESFDINARVPLVGEPGSPEYLESRASRIILRALQKYGAINTDNSGWTGGYLMGEVDHHTELKWIDLLDFQEEVGNAPWSNAGENAGVTWDDMEVVDWEWQFEAYEAYEALK